MTIKKFQKEIWDFYKKNKRELPWRKTKDPYKILVSEIMLQQTQVSRVIPKYDEWIRHFPDISTLALASPKEVLKYWQGLGYNRRGLNLHRAAKAIVEDHKGKIPMDPKILESLPGIGHYTARAIITFSKNKPFAFIETNIRTVLIHFFYGETKKKIDDKELLALAEKSLDTARPREWYSALMDYGVMLKRTKRNQNERSAHYTKQSAFKGSKREVRSAILKSVLGHVRISKKEVLSLPFAEEKIQAALEELIREGFIMSKGNHLYIHHG